MAKKEKKSAVPEQYKDIDFNKELANAPFETDHLHLKVKTRVIRPISIF